MNPETSIQDKTAPTGRWAFDAEVTTCFDDMLKRSIPQYDVMREACFQIGRRHVIEDTDIVDLGCSRGEALARFVDAFGAHNRFIGVEVSETMLDAARNRFQGLIDRGVVDIRGVDLRHAYPPCRASLTLSILTLQFTPIEYRQRIVADIYRHTVPGGAVIMVEKVLGDSAAINTAMVDVYYGMKGEHGYSQEQIERKRLSLEGVLVPVTARWNVELLRGAGFTEVDCFWRWMNFASWIGLKPAEVTHGA